MCGGADAGTARDADSDKLADEPAGPQAHLDLVSQHSSLQSCAA